MYLDKSSDYIESVIVEIRKISKTLVIPGTNIIGLVDNIKNLIHDVRTIHPIKIEFHEKNINEKELNEKMQLTIFRIVQEQFNNILKHSRATRATINLSRQENEVILLISDNGEGCDPLVETDGVGIINIRSRVGLCNGTVAITSRPGEGYALKIVLSLIAECG